MRESEAWVYLNSEGKLILRTENDGATFLRRGAEIREREVTLEQLCEYPRLHERAALLLQARAKMLAQAGTVEAAEIEAEFEIRAGKLPH